MPWGRGPYHGTKTKGFALDPGKPEKGLASLFPPLTFSILAPITWPNVRPSQSSRYNPTGRLAWSSANLPHLTPVGRSSRCQPLCFGGVEGKENA